jgi:hypothetical protein
MLPPAWVIDLNLPAITARLPVDRRDLFKK